MTKYRYTKIAFNINHGYWELDDHPLEIKDQWHVTVDEAMPILDLNLWMWGPITDNEGISADERVADFRDMVPRILQTESGGKLILASFEDSSNSGVRKIDKIDSAEKLAGAMNQHILFLLLDTGLINYLGSNLGKL
jgi:hypothetical protein